MDLPKARLVLGVWALLSAAAIVALAPLAGLTAVCAAGLVVLYFRTMSRRQFGGITGDLAGFFLQLCELGCILAMTVIPKVWEVLRVWF